MAFVSRFLAIAGLGLMSGCAAPPLSPDEVRASHAADARRLCSAAGVPTAECESFWLRNSLAARPTAANDRRVISDTAAALSACSSAGWEPMSTNHFQCTIDHRERVAANRAAWAGALGAIGAGLQAAGASYGASSSASPSWTAPAASPPMMPCPRPWGTGQVGQSGQRGQGANCL